MKRSLGKRAQRITLTTFSRLKDIKPRKGIIRTWRRPYRSVSCPCLAFSTGGNGPCTEYLPRSYSAIYHMDHKRLIYRYKAIPNQMLINFSQRRAASTVPNTKLPRTTANAMQNLEAACACPCPCPCPGGNCLPPPCNTPPKCLQYMTGYYYYPYGTWFCGPYHVSTGACGPCSGPVTPGGPCGPAGPCTGGPCGPPGVTPCCTCGPLSCCAVCNPGSSNNLSNHPNAQNTQATNASFGPLGMYSMYDPYAFNAHMNYGTYDPYTSFSHYGPWAQPNMPGPYFGPGFNVPITPIPMDPATCGNFFPIDKPPTPPASTTPKSSVRINPNFLKEAREAGMPSSAMPHIPKPAIPTRKAPKSSVYFNAHALIDPKAYTGARPIGSAEHPCSKNLTPKPLRQGPPSRYDATCNASRTNPFSKPRINKRTLPHIDSIQTCYYSTRSMQKYASETSSTAPKLKRKLIKDVKKDSGEINNKPICYWCILSDKDSRNHCQHCTNVLEKVPVTDIRSKSSRPPLNMRDHNFNEDYHKHRHTDWY